MSQQQQDRLLLAVDGTGRMQPLEGIDALLSFPINGGALCNDSLGLCIGSKGKIDTSQSGVYTTIARLAARLGENNADDSSSGRSRSESEVIETSTNAVAPLVTIETNRATLLVKEYEGNAVVFRVPLQK